MSGFRQVWLLGVALAGGCESAAAPRAQAVVYIDADVPVTAQAVSQANLSADPGIDVVRVEPIDDTGNLTGAAQDIAAPDPLDWPISFGVVGSSQVAHLRVRAYKSAIVTDPDDATQASTVIDRLVDVPVPSSGVGSVSVLLTGDCFGVPSSLVNFTTCVDANDPAGQPSDGVVALGSGSPPPTQIGTWAKAVAQPCQNTPPSGAVCIEGGVTFLGDLRLTGTEDDLTTFPSVPLRPVALTPFFLDINEFTVARFNSIVSQLPAGTTMPLMPTTPGSEDNVACTWLGPGDTSNDTKPINCLPGATAALACAQFHGLLPTEAQWEHAAKGRGQGRAYPWGNAAPACCSANVAFLLSSPFEADVKTCPTSGTLPVGSFVSDPCGGVNDASLDGVADMAGNVNEWVADQYHSYDDPCWGSGVPVNPMCTLQANMNELARGSDFSGDDYNPVEGMNGLREVGQTSPATGFRCAYQDSPP